MKLIQRHSIQLIEANDVKSIGQKLMGSSLPGLPIGMLESIPTQTSPNTATF